MSSGADGATIVLASRCTSGFESDAPSHLVSSFLALFRSSPSRPDETQKCATNSRCFRQGIAGYILSRELNTITDRDIDRAYSRLNHADKRWQRLDAMHEIEAEGWVKGASDAGRG